MSHFFPFTQLKKTPKHLCSAHQYIIIQTLLNIGFLGSCHSKWCMFWFFISFLWSVRQLWRKCFFILDLWRTEQEKINTTNFLDAFFKKKFSFLRRAITAFSHHPGISNFLCSEQSSCWFMHLINFPSTILICLVLVLPTHLQNLTVTIKKF